MTKGKGAKVTISERAAFQRINRKLKSEGEFLRTNRSQRVYGNWAETARFWVIDRDTNVISGAFNDLEAFGREAEVIQPWETVREEES